MSSTPWQHDHDFQRDTTAAERGTRVVLVITLIAMVIEIVAGWWFKSMALLADGWHMSSHALAIGLSVLAYGAARRLKGDSRYAFGTWKIEILGGYSSALFLLLVAGSMVVASVERFIEPQPIQYREAIVVAVLGLVVNLVCALILGQSHDHGHGHGHDHGHHHGNDHHHHDHHHGEGEDLNLRSAYVHVLTDALTSVLAIAALAAGWLLGWSWMDPVMGIVGGVLVAWWAKGLIASTSAVLLDREMDAPVVEEIREVVAEMPADDEVTLTDLHVWRVGQAHFACAMTVVTGDRSVTPDRVRQALAIHEEVVHATIEVHHRTRV